MHIFDTTRLKLTAWYLLIIALISISFSAIIYRVVTDELERGFMVAEYRIRGMPIPGQRVRLLLEDELADTKRLLAARLAVVNGCILAFSGLASYLLAGKSLQPIKVAMDEQKRFVADASHELKTPLTAIKTEIEVALRDKKFTLVQAKELLRSNLQETDKMKDLANYLLSLSRYESNGKDIVKERLDLKDVVDEAVDKNQVLAKKSSIKLVSDSESVIVNGNYQSLVELALILITNALKYSSRNKRVNVSVKKTGGSALFEVKDEGIGIAKADLPHIFDRFYRADSSRSKEVVDGYGLGLSIAKSIVQIHEGRIVVTSKPNKGSTFSVLLPLA
ncbi:MAG: histidine kinase [uncultured bacterium]|nr:MAG: histidine kinase [uncultured bacterium]